MLSGRFGDHDGCLHAHSYDAQMCAQFGLLNCFCLLLFSHTQVLEERQPTQPTEIELLGRARNLYVRVLATSGSATQAADLLDQYLKMQGKEEKPTLINADTYSVVVHELVKAGDGERANDVLESRDYLQE